MTDAPRGSSVFRQIVLLICASLLGGLLAQSFSPNRIPWKQDWSRYVESKALKAGLTIANLDDVRRIIQSQSHLLLDARPVADYDRGHLPGAMSLPQTDLATFYPQIAPMLSPDQPLLVYCSGHECDESLLLSVYLREQGFSNVTLFVGGYSEWKATGQAQEGR